MLIAVVVLVLLAGLPWMVWRGPYVFDGKYLDRNELAKGSAALVTGLRTAIVACIAALGAGFALFYTARTYRLTRRGQITERFTKALERLGSDHQYVRIGGILALEQIVQDAPEQAATDAARVLGHFIRDRAPKAVPAPDPDGPTPASTSPDPAPEKLPPEPDADVQEALTALTRPESRIHVDPREVLDLHGLHLAGAQLRQADLTGANLRGTTLTGAYLTRATLTKAVLAGATLTGAHLARATLTKAELPGANLTKANVSGATLTEAYLAGATLVQTNLSGATLFQTNLFGADLTKAKLIRATLIGAFLVGTTLTKADLSEATLTGAHLSGATLTEANLAGADFSRVRDFNQPLTEAQTDEKTVLPPEQQCPATP
ncbi:pentapeptide repeat-containing protein [Streptomyces sp. RK9]|uniref:pentapeptide repeat-containing protein n=1 Tax=Streptomyces sp. RK9 TaxID=3239284 RepID=UPI00386A132A